MPRKLLLIALVGILGSSVGCTVDVPEGAGPAVRVNDPRAPQAGIRYDSVVVLDKSLENWNGKVYDPAFAEYIWPNKGRMSRIAVEATNSRRTPTDTLEVWAVLRNRTDQPIQLEGRTHFFDADKTPAEGPTAWKHVFLPAQSVATYRELSTQVRGIGHYYIEIREGR